MKTPVAFIIFNRPDTTKRVFEAIREAKPPKLLVIADGPRIDRPGEAEKCAAARAIIDGVDWECEVLTNYSDVNLGCKNRPSTGITWVFEQVEEAIILEDDCLPHTTFFEFCEELLERYKYDERIMMISGTNFLQEWKSNTQSYHFSYFGPTWGWASWKRAWKHYDLNMLLWKEREIQQLIRDIISDEHQYQRLKNYFDFTVSDKNTSIWDYQWVFTRLLHSGLSIIPSVNLISNIGFGETSTHTKKFISGISDLELIPISLPLQHPHEVKADTKYSQKHNQKFMKKNLFRRALDKIKMIINQYGSVSAKTPSDA